MSSNPVVNPVVTVHFFGKSVDQVHVNLRAEYEGEFCIFAQDLPIVNGKTKTDYIQEATQLIKPQIVTWKQYIDEHPSVNQQIILDW